MLFHFLQCFQLGRKPKLIKIVSKNLCNVTNYVISISNKLFSFVLSNNQTILKKKKNVTTGLKKKNS